MDGGKTCASHSHDRLAHERRRFSARPGHLPKVKRAIKWIALKIKDRRAGRKINRHIGVRREKLMNPRHQPACGERRRHRQVQRHHVRIRLDRQRRRANMPERLADVARVTDTCVGQDHTLAVPHEKCGA